MRTTNLDRPAAEPLLESAVQLDPKFLDAWVLLAYVHAVLYGNQGETTPARLAKAKRAMERVLELAPGTTMALRVQGDFQLYCRGDLLRAAEFFEEGLRLRPDDAETIKQLSAVERRLGRYGPMLGHVRQYLEMEPADIFVRRSLSWMFIAGRRFVLGGVL